jgi:hypothetical protein
MKQKFFIKIIFFIVAVLAFQTHSYSQYAMKSSVFSNGGGTTANANFVSHSTLGQTAAGLSASSNHLLHSGFWYSSGLLTSVDNEELGLPTVFELFQNYPNPFNPSTTIKYAVPEPANVRIEIFNMLGQSVEVLLNEEKAAGYYTLSYNASRLASGVYIYRMISNSYVETKKFMLLK